MPIRIKVGLITENPDGSEDRGILKSYSTGARDVEWNLNGYAGYLC